MLQWKQAIHNGHYFKGIMWPQIYVPIMLKNNPISIPDSTAKVHLSPFDYLLSFFATEHVILVGSL